MPNNQHNQSPSITMNTPDTELDRLVLEQQQADEREKTILARLLQKALDRQGYWLVHASAMGKVLTETGVPKVVPSYAATHTLEWIAANIKLGSQMPFMETKIDRDPKSKTYGRLMIDRDNVEKVKQRAPDWTRQPALAAYLAQPQRKFGPIIAVISPDWVDNPQHENWDKSGRALKSSTEFHALDLEGRLGLLKIGGAKLYALDGQHRVIGIMGLRDVRDNPIGLVMRTKEGKEKGRAYSREEFQERFHVTIEDLQSILNESMIVEYLPAVIAGETHEEASRRIRNTFVAINSYARNVDKGETILLDDMDPYAIIAKKAGVFHPLFDADGKNNRVNWKTTSIPNQRTAWYTTLQTIKEAAKAYLSALNGVRAKAWSPEFAGMVPLRPQAEEITQAIDEFSQFLDYVYHLPLFQMLEKADKGGTAEAVTKWREFPDEDTPDSRGHLLLRPVGQLILAEAVGTLIKPKNEGGRSMALSAVFEKLSLYDKMGGFEAHRPENVWMGVTYDTKKEKMITTTRARGLAHDLLVYLVDGMEGPQLASLWKEFTMARLVDPTAGTWLSLSGAVKPIDLGKIELPSPM